MSVIRAAEAVVEVATDEAFNDMQTVGRVTNVSINRQPKAGVVNDLGSFTPVETFYEGEGEVSFSFNLTPEASISLTKLGLMPDAANPGVYAGFHMRLRTARAKEIVTLAKLYGCQPSGDVGLSLEAQGHMSSTYKGIAQRADVFL
jgi:hypothetical protein